MRRVAQRWLHRLGYDVGRAQAHDPMTAQRWLLQGKPQPLIFDAGAYVGDVTMRYRRRFPDATIYAFEPFPRSFALLQQRIAGDGRIRAFCLALSGTAEKATLRSNASSATNSLLETAPEGTSYWGPSILDTRELVQIDPTTIDEFCGKHAVPGIDILKLDIQGAELLALMGAREMLARQAIALVFAEILIVPTYKGQSKFHEIAALLDSFGYELFDIYDPVRKNRRLAQVDILFISPLIRSRLTDSTR